MLAGESFRAQVRETMKIGTENSNVLSLTSTFYHGVLKDACEFFPDYTTASLDLDYIHKRISLEGDKFVSLSLPLLGKAIENSLITLQKFECPKGFQIDRGSSLPKFLSFLLRKIFQKDGELLYKKLELSEKHDAVFSIVLIRQITLSFSKVRDIPCVQTAEEAKEGFISRITTERNISVPTNILTIARFLISRLVMDGDELHPMLAQWESNPFGRHGPGAVAGREKGRLKWAFGAIKGADPLLYKWNHNSFEPKKPACPFSRITTVPKDFRKQRVICIEPKELQFAQQGLMDVLYSLVENDKLASKSISFRDQEGNRNLCKDYNYSTIDLKDASDLVSLKLCRLLFPRKFFKLATRYRSRGIMLNKHDVVRKISCFATMGSALCFPIETIVFWSLALATMINMGSKGKVRVFGDDIIVPNEAYKEVIKTLTSAGFVINLEKSCHNTLVRESCGSWLYSGYDAEYTKIYYRQCASFESWLALLDSARLLHYQFFDNAATAILDFLHENGCHPLPYGHNGILPLREVRKDCLRWNKDLQRKEIRIPSPFAGRGRCQITDDAVLYAHTVNNDPRPSPLGTVKVKMVWTEFLAQ